MDICSFALLDRVSNPHSLQQELTALLRQNWLSHVNHRDYREGHRGGWDVLALRCAAEYQVAHPILQAFSITEISQWQDLPCLESSPALLSVIQSLACPVKSVRLMRLHSGAEIKPHRDIGLCLAQGEARLHLPLQTNDALNFYVDGKRVPMRAGELWYINADQVHWVENKGQEARINLVIDCEVNTWLRELVYAAKIRA
ncbi:aspartyl/asparaginyl beta-hydroxylase domain-containing protein [Shewanella sp. CG12_big_fil_rev_8_21_14_0_65_47_15]|uniref:aspartyl/asparaginyl beta-hydroxylase domain-containing protein n=1 Tax=Shewanella sp. CG12_big_fil_rev_8_21_14_0_65_47_15 TaxID=1975537 RepID=UPI000CAB4758|nr:aspartyl/asparaginyl beta-hydroxylase domain-containing protein [Shewanella sp. CG12_big_fil_rev_8_21_14_0_65_47_15]PIW60188.1 MAG: aspartyl beta-hydroxylase [Shewanella sp. CG12_big_fil_rev_8_21_14_0_65_47_15]